MKAGQRGLGALLANSQDIVLPIMLMTAVFMTILPLPTFLVDILIGINFAMSSALLMISIFVRNPLELSAFPSMLLITTLYRLALTISTCRLILLQHDAGEIVSAFGNFVVGDNLIVGLVVFVIIAIVQFLVVTKGAERVAEVLARFSLDGMPGAQMSIDGDLRAGLIDAHEARRQRNVLRKTSQMYGAMDGALKFVKGDAIASMIVIVVNILGGIGVGVLQHGMTAAQAGATYTILSIGDGLVTQIPALLISIAAGILATRVPDAAEQPESLSRDLTAQIGREFLPLVITAGVMSLFAILPGFPTAIFMGLAMLLMLLGQKAKKSRAASAAAARVTGGSKASGPTPGARPLLLRLASGFDPRQIDEVLQTLVRKKYDETGLPYPDIVIDSDERMDPDCVELHLYEEPVMRVRVLNDFPMVVLDTGTPPLATVHEQPLFGDVVFAWLDDVAADEAAAAGLTLYRGMASIAACVSTALDYSAREFIGVQEAQFLMNAMESKYADLVRELNRQMAVGKVADVLQRLVEERVSIRDLRTIFETLIVWVGREKDMVLLTEYVRVSLRRHILRRCKARTSMLPVWTIGTRIENMIRESIRQTSAGSYSALTPDQSRRIYERIRDCVTSSDRAKGSPVIITTVDVRRYLRKLLEASMPSVYVLSFQELGDEAQTYLLGDIELFDVDQDHAAA